MFLYLTFDNSLYIVCSVEWKRERIEFVVAHFKTIKATGSLSYRQRGALVADFIPTPQFPLLHSVNLMCTLAFLTSTLMLSSGRPSKKSKFSVEERVLFQLFLQFHLSKWYFGNDQKEADQGF